MKISLDNNNINNYENNVVVNNYFAKKGQALYGDKYLNDKNLFMYQNYIPRKKIKYFLNNNSEEIENNLENNDNLIKSQSENKISENKINFQNYFQNIIINPSTYNYFHYKLFDTRGNELSKLKNYNNSSKIILFSKENNVNNNKNDLNNKNNLINNVLNNNNVKKNINNNINNNNDNILNQNISPKLSLFNNINIDNNLGKYQNKKRKVLFEDSKPLKIIINNDNKEEKNIINNNILFNNNFGPDRSSLKRKEMNKRLFGNNEIYQPY